LVLADSSSPVFVFETACPRVLLNRTKWTSPPWHRATRKPPAHTRAAPPVLVARIGETVHADIAWTYDFPTRQLLPIAGLIAFYNEHVD